MHDLYCAADPCDCERLKKVRADERSLIRVSRASRDLIDRAYANGYQRGHTDALQRNSPNPK